MKKKNFTIYILIFEIVAIVLLHIARVNNDGMKNIAKTRNKAIIPTLQFRPEIILPVLK